MQGNNGTPAFKADCGHQIPALPPGHTGGTGYAVQENGRKVCYWCAGAHERQQMIETGRGCLYLINSDRDGAPRWVITDWPGTFELRAYGIMHSWGVTPSGARFPIVAGCFDLAGHRWYFRVSGDMQLARCRAYMRNGSRVASGTRMRARS